MNTTSTAKDLLQAGDPAEALKLLQQEVRGKPGDPKLRVFLFQLLCVLGQWERALTQLQVISELDQSALPMVQTYREAIQCEAVRNEVFAGHKSPLVMGQPEPWLGLLIEALLLGGRGEWEKGQILRQQAFEQAPASAGAVEVENPGSMMATTGFDWIADGDMRLGPVLEAVVNGRYYWLPFNRLTQIQISRPEDLRDAVWMPAHLFFDNGGETVALIPTRYPGSAGCGDGMLMLSRRSEWQEISPGFFTGLGQRILTTSQGDFPLMDLRSIHLESPEGGAGDEGEGS